MDFYIPFLSAIYDDVQQRTNVAIFAHALIGHVPGLEPAPSVPYDPKRSLDVQVEGFLEFFETIASFYAEGTRFVFLGHSVGCWIGLQVNAVLNSLLVALCLINQALREHVSRIEGFFLLCPTLSHMATTPNGVLMKVRFLRRVTPYRKPLTLAVFSAYFIRSRGK